MSNEEKVSWIEEILNPDAVRTKFVTMGLFLVAHELLIDSITTRPLSFFADEWPDAKPKPSTEYEAEILALDPKGKNDALRGSIAWLQKMSAIDDLDKDTVHEVTMVRNTFAHEMRNIVSGQSELPNLEQQFPKLLDLITKIERWWFVAVEMSILSDSDGRIPDIHGTLHSIADIDESETITGSMMAMRILCQVALGDHDEAWALHHIFSGLRRK